jgi:hypothetical protein
MAIAVPYILFNNINYLPVMTAARTDSEAVLSSAERQILPGQNSRQFSKLEKVVARQ